MTMNGHPRHFEEGHDDNCGCGEQASPAQQQADEAAAERARPIPSRRDEDE